jgi:hypothetical protein
MMTIISKEHSYISEYIHFRQNSNGYFTEYINTYEYITYYLGDSEKMRKKEEWYYQPLRPRPPCHK